MVKVQVGNIVAIALGKDPLSSRQQAFDDLAIPASKNKLLHGFYEQYHALVIPQTPFKPNTKERWPDKGLHITVAMEGRNSDDVVTEDAMALDGKEVVVSFKPQPKFLEGQTKNDEACGCVYYVVLYTDSATDKLVADLRAQIGLDPKSGQAHVTIAVDGSVNKDVAM